MFPRSTAWLLTLTVLLSPAATGAQTTLDITVAAGNDDGFEDSGGDLKLSDDKIELAKHPWAACRFQNVTVPQGATITDAYVRFTAASDESSTIDVNIVAEDVDNAGSFSGSNYLSNRTTTLASVNWTTGNWSENDTQDTPDIKSVIQEVVDRSGWSSGNSIAILFDSNDTSRQQFAWSRDNNSSDAPVLHVEYTTASIGNLLFVRAGSSYTSQEQARVTQFEAWGYAVTPIEDGDSQVNFDVALASADVVYVSEEVSATSVSFKLRQTTVGVVSEERALDSEMGFSTSDGVDYNGSAIQITDNSHEITSGFSTGSLTITSSTQALAYTSGTEASGAQALAEFGGAHDLSVFEVGATLANTSSSNSTASGRRVRLPWGGDSFDWSNLNANGLLIAQRALEWASGGGVSGDLVAHWKLDESSGTTALDSSGNGNHGTLVASPVWTTGAPRGRGLDVDSGDRVDAGNFAVSGSTLSLSAWFYVENYSNDARIIMRSSGNSGAADQSWGLIVEETGGLEFRLTAGGSLERIQIAGVIQEQRWHHVVATYDGTDAHVYLDGQLIDTTTLSPGGAINDVGSHTVTIGDTIAGGRAFDGVIDDIRVYNRTLSKADVKELYGLLGHYKLEETSGTVATDSSGVGNDGTHVNSPNLGVSAVRGAGATYNGVDNDDRTEIPSEILDGKSTYSLAWWVKTESTGVQTILSGANAGQSNAVLLVFPDDDTLECQVNASANFYSIESIADGQWNHFVYQHDRITGVEKVYQNGQLVGQNTRSATTTPLDIDDGGLMLVQEQDSVGGGFDTSQTLYGSLDDVRVYDRMLSDAEVAEVYGLIGHWKLDESSETVATDSSGAGNTGAYQGGSAPGGNGPFPGRGAIAAEFDGAAGAKVALPTMDYDFSDGVTLAVWYKADSISGPYTDFLSLSNGSLVDDIWFGFDNTGGLDLFLSDTADGAAFRGLIEGSAPVLGEWRHAVAVIDSAGNATLYHDGVVVQTGFTGLPRLTSRASNGIGETTFSHTLDGLLYDARIYNRPISSAEVAELYGLVGHWKFDEGSGVDIADSSGLDNDAAFNTGNPQWVSGQVNGAIEFDGGDDTITGRVFDPPATGAVAFWFRPQNNFTTSERLLGLGGNWEVRTDSFGFMVFDLSGDGIFDAETSLYANSAGAWHHIVAMYDSDSDTFEVYGDGVLIDSGSNAASKQAANFLSFGTRTGSSERFAGALDDLRVYNRWLSTDEIAGLSSGTSSSAGVRIMRWVEVR